MSISLPCHLTKGFRYKEIAEALSISCDAVHTHIRKIYQKLHARSRTEAASSPDWLPRSASEESLPETSPEMGMFTRLPS